MGLLFGPVELPLSPSAIYLGNASTSNNAGTRRPNVPSLASRLCPFHSMELRDSRFYHEYGLNRGIVCSKLRIPVTMTSCHEMVKNDVGSYIG